MAFKKRDWLFIAVIVLIIGVFIAISGEETTVRVPDDEIHHEYFRMVEVEGKKATEEFCKECHQQDNLPLSEDHPPPFRCLFCHKFEE